MAALSEEKNAHAPSEVVGRASEVAGGPFKFLTSILYILSVEPRDQPRIFTGYTIYGCPTGVASRYSVERVELAD